MRAHKLSILITTFAVVALCGCGGKSKSDDADITINPTQPIVITGNFNYSNNGTSTTVTGPWFKFSVGMNNQTGDTVTIVSLELDVTGVDQSGNFTTKTSTFDPSQFNYSNDVLTCSYSSFGEFKNKDSQDLYVKSSDACATGSVAFYASGNPDPGDLAVYSYSSKLKLLGWFGTYDKPTDRFDRTVYFTTQ